MKALSIASLLVCPLLLLAQPPDLVKELKFRQIGPFRGGRSVAVTGVAALCFTFSGAVYWPQAAVMTVGAVIGGYLGAHFAQRLPQSWVRGFVILVGTGMTAYFFVKAY